MMTYHPNFPPSLSITPNIAHFTNETLKHDSEDVFGVEAQREAISSYGIAGRVWEAAYALCVYIDPTVRDFDFDPPFVEDPNELLGIIELGSGTGIVAANIAREVGRSTGPGGFVIATDLPDVCPLLERNLGVNALTDGNHCESDVVFVRSLAWGNLDHATSIMNEFSLHRLTHIVCSDLVYFPELFGPLLRTLIHLTSPSCALSSGPLIKVVISYKIRSLPKETPFWSAFGLWFSFHPVLARCGARPIEGNDEKDSPDTWRQFGTHEDADRTFIFVGHRRPESIAWHVPKCDKELMEGVGAEGTRTKKGDDTFETILLMAIDVDNIGE